MDEIIKFVIKKINISISLIFGIFFTGVFYLIRSEFNLFIEMDIFKFLLLSTIITIPSFLIIIGITVFFGVFEVILFNNNSKEEFLNKAFFSTAILQFFLYYAYSKPFNKDYIFDEGFYLICVLFSIGFSLSGFFIESILLIINKFKSPKRHFLNIKNKNIDC